MTAARSRTAMLAGLVRDFGSPLYVYQLDAVRRAAAALSAALPPRLRTFYSLKANPHPRLVAVLAERGFDPEISSVGELASTVEASVPAERVFYTGPGKTADETAHAIRSGVRLFSVESLADRDRLVAAAGGTDVEYLVRLNAAGGPAAAGLRMTGNPSQFGVEAETLDRGTPLLQPVDGVRPAGFHVFSATNLSDPTALRTELAANIAAVTDAARRTGMAPRLVDIGGGFGAPYAAPGVRPEFPALREELAGVLDARLPGWRDGAPVVCVESGRHLVAEAGTLLTTVLDVKRSRGSTYVVCDAGINVLGGMHGLGRLLAPAVTPEGVADSGPDMTLTGPLCTPLDVLSRSVRLPDPRPGDLLSVPNVGAYGLTASLVAFLGRPLPAEVVLDGDRVVDARRLQLSAAPVPQGTPDSSIPTRLG